MLRAWASALVLAAVAPFIPNDPGFEPNRASLDAMSVPQAWSLTQGDPAVVIAVIDTGVTPGDLELTPGHNFLDGSADTTDLDGHGTAMARIAAAKIDNGIGDAGICGACRVMPLKAEAAHVGAAIDWAVEHGATVIDVSCNDTPAAATKNALAHGVPVFSCKNAPKTAFADPATATAATAGVAALMVGCNPALTPGEITTILGAEVNAYNAVKRAGCSASPPEIVRLIVRTRGRGTVTRRPDDDTYNAGTKIALRAKPKQGWRFARWGGLCRSQRALCTVRLTESGTTTAVFKRR